MLSTGTCLITRGRSRRCFSTVRHNSPPRQRPRRRRRQLREKSLARQIRKLSMVAKRRRSRRPCIYCRNRSTSRWTPRVRQRPLEKVLSTGKEIKRCTTVRTVARASTGRGCWRAICACTRASDPLSVQFVTNPLPIGMYGKTLLGLQYRNALPNFILLIRNLVKLRIDLVLRRKIKALIKDFKRKSWSEQQIREANKASGKWKAIILLCIFYSHFIRLIPFEISIIVKNWSRPEKKNQSFDPKLK